MNDQALTERTATQAVQVFNPLDASPADFKQLLVSRQDNYDALAIHLRGMLIPGHDFGQIHVAGKQKCPNPWDCSVQRQPRHWSPHMLFAAGADKVLGMLGLGVHYPGEQDIMRAALTGKPIAEVIVKCQIVDKQGQVIAEEMGACARSEVKDSLNNAVKRACKRARVGAVLRLPSISALFEADHLAEIEKAAAASGGNSTAARSRQPNGEKHSSGAALECMPFGKHQGEKFSDLDTDYLEWLLMNMHDKPDIHEAARKANEARSSASGPAQSAPASSESGEDLPPVEAYDDEIPF